MTNNLFDRYLPSALGFDRVFDVLDHANDFINSSNATFPPVNIVKLDDINYAVELAVAGFTEEEITVETEKNLLKISGKKTEKDERTYVVKGIAGRTFFRQFVLADTMVVRDAALKNGVLTVSLENVIPEAQKPRKIAVLAA